jgi:hypothetical protein
MADGDTVTVEPMDRPTKWGAQVGFAIFAGTPEEQMVYSVIASIAAYVATVLSFGATAVLIFLFSTTFLIGAGRYVLQWVRNR